MAELIPDWLWKGPFLWPFLGVPKDPPFDKLPDLLTKENIALGAAIGLVGLACGTYVVARTIRTAGA